MHLLNDVLTSGNKTAVLWYCILANFTMESNQIKYEYLYVHNIIQKDVTKDQTFWDNLEN